MKQYYVYILASKKNGTIYIGLTSNLLKRVNEHKSNIAEGFTKKYNCHFIVYYEHFTFIEHAIDREKEIKKWRREKKDKLVTSFNPEWKFLNEEIYENF